MHSLITKHFLSNTGSSFYTGDLGVLYLCESSFFYFTALLSTSVGTVPGTRHLAVNGMHMPCSQQGTASWWTHITNSEIQGQPRSRQREGQAKNSQCKDPETTGSVWGPMWLVVEAVREVNRNQIRKGLVNWDLKTGFYVCWQMNG